MPDAGGLAEHALSRGLADAVLPAQRTRDGIGREAQRRCEVIEGVPAVGHVAPLHAVPIEGTADGSSALRHETFPERRGPGVNGADHSLSDLSLRERVMSASGAAVPSAGVPGSGARA